MRTEEQLNRYKNPDNHPKGPWAPDNLMANVKGGRYVKSLYFPIVNYNTGEKFWPSSKGNWRFNKEKIEELIKNNEIYFGMDGKGRPKLKRFLCDVKEGIPFPSIWDNVGYTNTATAEIADFFGSVNIFDTPKPTSLLREILSLATNKKENSIILDFMAGSGTTGQAVLELNKEDGSNHQFILCTNNENNICSDVCYPRIEKAIRGYKNSKREKVEGLVGNLKYFKTDVVNAESTDKNKKKLTEQATEMLCIREGTFELVLEQKKIKIFKNNKHYTGIIFDQLAISEFKKAIKDIKGRSSVYVFSLGDDTFDEEFEDVKQKVKLSPIPEAILRVYRRIFK
jgi:adenine-specific DNA-methyltransferase